jgi:thioredoxin
MILETTDATFATDIQSDLPVIVDLWAPWCGPCKALEPKLKQIAEDHEGRLKVLKLNVDEAPALTERFKVRGIPTLLFFVDGEECNRVTGASILRVRVLIEKLLEARGVAPSVSHASPSEEPTPQAALAVLRTFGGDKSVKAACLTRLQEMPRTKESYPAQSMAGGNGLFESVVGAPRALGFLFNLVWLLQFDGVQGPESAHRELSRLVEMMPVGSDLGWLHKDVMYWLLYKSSWSVRSFFSRQVEHDILEKMKALHERELAGVQVPQSTWEALQRDAVLLVDVSNPDALAGISSQRIERFARSLNHSVDDVPDISEMATEDLSGYSEWTAEDGAKWEEISTASDNRLKEEVGSPPRDPQAQAEWLPRATEFSLTLRRQNQEAHSELFKRHDAWVAHCHEVRRKLGHAIVEFMIDRLQSHSQDFSI